MPKNSPFSVRDKHIDNSHDEFIRLMDSSKDANSKSQLLALVIDIYKHASVHFIEEEQFMSLQNMPTDFIKEHRSIHEKLRRRIQSVIVDINAMDFKELREVVDNLREIMIDHIHEVDSQMVEHLQE